MTHDQSISTLLGTAPRSTVEQRQAAKEHVARCSDCWDVLRALHEITIGEPPPESERMAALYGCDDVRNVLHLLAGLPATEIQATHPRAAAHLGWCGACRSRLTEIVGVEAAAARGDFGTMLLGGPSWREVRDAVHGLIQEAVGRIVVRVYEAAAAFSAVPEGFVLSPEPVVAGALRGRGAPEVRQARELRFPLGDSGLLAELRLEPEGGQRASLGVRVSGPTHGVLSVCLRPAVPDAGAVLARYTARGPHPVVLKGLRPGPYLLEVLERERQLRFRLRLDVEAAG